jgi:predicted nucleotidyltransferase
LNLPIDIEELRALLRSHGVVKASVFGSYSRGEGGAGSDLDLLVTLGEGSTYLDLGGLQFELSERIAGGVDIMTRLNKHFEPFIRDDLIEIL